MSCNLGPLAYTAANSLFPSQGKRIMCVTNATMMIDFALEAQRKEGQNPEDAIYEGSSFVFRPLMMTSATALMGTLPLPQAIGAGCRNALPLGMSEADGLQLVTPYRTPVFYMYMERMKNRITRMVVGGRWTHGQEAHPARPRICRFQRP